jgi:hypothetical protein
MDLEFLGAIETVPTETVPPPKKLSFVKKYETALWIAGTVLVIGGLGWFFYENKQTNQEVNGTLAGVNKKIRTHKKTVRSNE